jgi:hypothetical protein
MTANRPYLSDKSDSKPNVKIGPRVEREIALRIHALSSRHPTAITAADKRELHKLRVLAHLMQSEGDQ